jgi:uncharacterized SAM-binding protein YcdF (DUF218 family)
MTLDATHITQLPQPIAVAANEIWSYHQLNHELKPAKVILGLGSNDPRVSNRCVELLERGFANTIVFSGGVGALTQDIYEKSEAEVFRDVAIALGVHPDRILLETKSRNTGENIQFSEKLFKENNLDADSVIIVQKPFMERRTFATASMHWPDKEILVTSTRICLADYPSEELGLSLRDILDVAVGDLQRIAIYPAKGFQIYQFIPQSVWDSLHVLVRAGFTRHLIRSTIPNSEDVDVGYQDLMQWEGLAKKSPT